MRCCVTDGVFATYTTMVPYMRQWYRIYNEHYVIQGLLPPWYYGILGMVGMHWIEDERKCHFVSFGMGIRQACSATAADDPRRRRTYIKPEMASRSFNAAGSRKNFG